MRSTFKILFYIDKNVVKADGTTAVKCRLSVDGKRSVLSTGVFCKPEEWNPKIECRELIQLRERIEQTYNHLLGKYNMVSVELLKNTVNGVNSSTEYLLEAGEVQREKLRLRSLEIKSTSSYRQSKTTQQNLRDFIESRGAKDIHFKDVTHEFGESFKLYLKRNMKYKSTHINHCLCWLNRLLYIAVDKEILRYNPIEEVEYEKKEKPKLAHITREELKRIMETPLPDPMGEFARRVFIFSSFCGLAYVDMQRLYPHHISKTSDGDSYIRINRAKTDVESFIPLHPIAEQILHMYNMEDDSKPIFPQRNRDMIWKEINQIGYIVDIKHNLSYHQSRHNFGTLMLDAGIPIESVSKMMGHTNISSTQVYAKVTDEKISKDMDMLMERRKVVRPQRNNNDVN